MRKLNDKIVVKKTNKDGIIFNIDYGFPTLYLVKHGETYKSYSDSELTDKATLFDIEQNDVVNFIFVTFIALFMWLGAFVVINSVYEEVQDVHTSIGR